MYGPEHLMLLAVAYALTLAPVLYVLSCLEHQHRMMALALLSGLPFVLLYGVAVDWGRWMSMHVFSMMVVTMAALWSGFASLRHPPPALAVAGIMGVSGLWVPNVTLRFVEWVWLRKIFTDIAEILG